MEKPLPKNARFIPKEAKLVFKGVIFDVYQWQQEMFDGSFETFEMLKRPDSVRVLAIHGDKIVTIHEEQPSGIVRPVGIPQGRVDPSDASPHAAIQRELKEETGLEFANWQLLQVYQPEPKIEWFSYAYVAQNKVNQVEPIQDGGEKITLGLSDFEEVRKAHARTIPALIDIHSLEELLEKLKEETHV